MWQSDLWFHALTGPCRQNSIAKRHGVGWQRLAYACCVGLCLLAGSTEAVPSLRSNQTVEQRFLQDRWQLAEGLPQLSVWAIEQSVDGYLWLATEEGLVRFDGRRFVVFDRHHFENLPSDFVTALVAAPDGGLWLGSQQGLAYLAESRGEKLHTVEESLGTAIHSLLLDRHGTLWIGSEAGLFHLAHGPIPASITASGPAAHPSPPSGGQAERAWQRATIRTAEGQLLGGDLGQVHALLEAKDGDLLIGSDRGLIVVEEGRGRIVAADGEPHAVLALYEDSAGRRWVGGADGLYEVVDEGGRAPRGSTLSPSAETLRGLTVNSLQEGAEGGLWIGTDEGLFRWLDGELLDVGERLPLPDQHIVSMFRGSNPSLWVGTRYGGLVRFRERTVRTVGVAEGLSHDIVWSLFEDDDDNVWIATDGGLDRLASDGRIVNLGIEDGLPARDLAALYQDRRGDIWVGTFGHGLVRISGQEISTFGEAEGIPAASIRALAEDAAGDLWIGTQEGLLRRTAGQFEIFGTDHGLPDDAIRGLHLDPEGRLWIATLGGLAHLDGGANVAFVKTPEAFPGTPKSLWGDDDGTLWVGTWDEGLVRYRDGVFDRVSVDDGLRDHRIHALVKDDHGGFWMSSNGGISRVPVEELGGFLAGDRAKVSTIALDERDGMRVRECNGATQDAALRTTDGLLWFATIAGVAIVDPARLREVGDRPRMVIEGVRGNGLDLAISSQIAIPPRVQTLEIAYNAIHFIKGEETRFTYRLSGFSEAWTEAGTRRSMQFTNLKPGPYRFEVRARTSEGLEPQAAAVLEFEVLPAFHQTLWFYGLLAAFLVLVVLIAHLWRVRVLIGHRTELVSMTREIESKNAELERFAYTVSHDLKSPLFTIEGFLGMLELDVTSGRLERLDGNIERIRSAVAKMRRLLDDLLELSRVGRVVQPPQRVDLREVVDEVVELLHGKIEGEAIDLRVADDLPMLFGDPVRLREVLQNLVENAIKYMGDQERPRIEIGALPETKETTIFVRDNGMGVASQYLDKIFGLFEQLDPNVPGSGIGLAMVKRIVEFHGGTIWAVSDGPGHGTTFFVALPKEKAG